MYKNIWKEWRAQFYPDRSLNSNEYKAKKDQTNENVFVNVKDTGSRYTHNNEKQRQKISSAIIIKERKKNQKN